MAPPLLSRVGVWLAIARHDERATDDLQGQMQALERFAHDVHGRMVRAGVSGVDEVLSAYDRLRDVVDRIPLDEIDRMLAEIETVQRRLTQAARDLEGLRQVKRSLPDVS